MSIFSVQSFLSKSESNDTLPVIISPYKRLSSDSPIESKQKSMRHCEEANNPHLILVESIAPREVRMVPHGKARLRELACVALSAVVLLSSGCGQEPLPHAQRLMERGQFQATVDFLQGALENSPSDMDLLEIYGRALLRNKQPSLAVWPLRRVFHDQGLEGSALVPLVEALARGGAPGEAVELATQGLAVAPANRTLLALRSGASLASLNHEVALADIEQLIALDAENLRYRENRMNILVKLERIEEAGDEIAFIADQLAKDASLPAAVKSRYCATSALFQHKEGDSEKAEVALADCLATYPADPEVLIPFVQFLEESGQGDRVLELLDEQAGSPAGRGRLMLQVLLAAQLRGLGREAEASEVLLKTAEYLEAPPAWLELADHYVAVDDMVAAADAVSLALADSGDGLGLGDSGAYRFMSEDGLFAYADVLVQAKRFEQARKILPHLDEEAHSLFIEARILLAEGEPRLALEKYEEAFKFWPSNPGARYLAAVAAMRIGEFDRAASLFQDSMRSDSTISDAGVILGRMQLLQGSTDAAFDTLALHSMKNRGNTTVLRLMMRAAVLARAPGALIGIQREFEKGGHFAEGLAEHALGLEALQGPVPALELLEAEEQLESPEYFLALASWARITASQGDLAGALERVRAVAAAQPESAPAQVVLGMTLSSQPDSSEEAGVAYRRATELDDEFPEAWVLLGRLLEANGDADGAVEAYTRAAALDKGEPTHNYRAGVALLGAGDEEAGEERLRRILEEHPWHGDSAAWLARLAFDRGDSGPETLVLARLAARFSEELTANALETLGKVRMERGEFPEANVAFRRLVQRQSNPGISEYYLAQSLVGMGQNEAAIERLNEALAHEVSFPFEAAARSQLAELTQAKLTQDEEN